MTCNECLRAIDPYLDGELSVMHALQMHGHLVFCERCRRVMESEAVLHAAITSVAREGEPPASLRARILERVREEAVQSPQPRSRPGRFAVLWGVLASAAVVGLLLILSMIPGSNTVEEPAPVAAQLAAKHRLYAAGGGSRLDITTPEASQITAWLEPRLGFAVDLPQLPGAAQRLVGARVSSVADAPAAYLLYEWGGRRVSLFVARRLPAARLGGITRVVDGVELHTTGVGDVALAWWEEEDEGRLYAAVSTGGDRELLQFAVLCVRSGRRSHTEMPETHEVVLAVGGTQPEGQAGGHRHRSKRNERDQAPTSYRARECRQTKAGDLLSRLRGVRGTAGRASRV